MSNQRITKEGIVLEIERKRVKNVNFTVYPPDGRVRISAPTRMSEVNLRRVIQKKLPWIKRHRNRIIAQTKPVKLNYISGEIHAYLGKRYSLQVLESRTPSRVELARNGTIRMWVREGSDRREREKVLIEWYREQLKSLIPPIVAHWESVTGVEVAEWRVKRMKTRWGSCSIKARRIWLNLELIKYPPFALEYIIVHEMVHLLERLHSDQFYRYLDQFMPEWRRHKELLDSARICHRKMIAL